MANRTPLSLNSRGAAAAVAPPVRSLITIENSGSDRRLAAFLGPEGVLCVLRWGAGMPWQGLNILGCKDLYCPLVMFCAAHSASLLPTRLLRKPAGPVCSCVPCFKRVRQLMSWFSHGK